MRETDQPGAARGTVAGLVLAAGGGRRLGGRAKALVEIGGEPLVERAVRTARLGGCDPVVVVLGSEAEAVRQRADLGDCVVAVNEAWADGMGSSLRVGLAAIPSGCRAVAILLVDQPFVTPEAVRAVIGSGAPIAAATYGGHRAHPVLIASEFWEEVAASAVGDQGARAFLAGREVTLVECEGSAADIDTPADLARYSD